MCEGGQGDMEACRWVDTWGSDGVTALANQCAFLQERGYDVECRPYPGVGHEWTAEMMADIYRFFAQCQAEDVD
jgi:hypothetical protein